MVAGGIPGVMLFTSVVSEPKLQRLVALNTRAEGLMVVVDDLNNVDQLGFLSRQCGHALQVLVDLELGGGRTGLSDVALAIALARRIQETEGLEFVGIQAYNGLGLSDPDYDARRSVLLRRLRELSEMVARFDDEGIHPSIVSGGGTGSHDIDPEAGIFTEIQVGTYIFMDGYYMDTAMRRDDAHPFQPALTVRGTVVSAAQAGFVITDVGVKEIDGAFGFLNHRLVDGAPLNARYSIVGDDLGRIDFANAEDRLPIGATFEILPPRCFQTITMYSVYHCVAGDELVDIWPIDSLRNW